MGDRAQTHIKLQHADNVFYLKQILRISPLQTQCYPTQEKHRELSSHPSSTFRQGVKQAIHIGNQRPTRTLTSFQQ